MSTERDAADAAEGEIEGPVPEHVAVYRRIRALFGSPVRSRDARRRDKAAAEGTSSPYGPGRDPRGIDDVLGALTRSRGWDGTLARAELLAAWPDLVGAETAAHAEPASLEDATLTVRCDSTAWAQQLRLMQSTILGRIEERYPGSGVSRVTFIGPDAPSWKRGRRAIPGRGPRDTYG